ncbi:acyl-homoserine-lactone synthase [Streptomyces rubellomurinus]|uniref:acyl-homoserine-lactone synthase n=1 Tax=Streptomyces rubellomurinus (strain ATCC 31215) TaxID=359131 RepID=UPI000A3E2897|nr:acyl-homoserine-lactone synthase [Streptomyces rubellomurinus]
MSGTTHGIPSGHRIVVGRAGEPELAEVLVDAMFRLRHRVFHERLRWQVRSRDGRERDVFDDAAPVYAIAYHQRSGRVSGCLRMLPTTGPYILRDVFPQALRGAPAPCDERIWELSRLCVVRDATTTGLARRLLGAAADHAARGEARQFVTVAQSALERAAARAGITTHRFGGQQSTRLGNLDCAALRLPVAALTTHRPSWKPSAVES